MRLEPAALRADLAASSKSLLCKLGQRGRGVVRVRVRVRVAGDGWDHVCVCVQCVCPCLHTCAHVQGVGLAVLQGHNEAFRGVGEERMQASLQRSIRAHWVVRTQRTGEQVHGLLFLLSVGTSFRLRNSDCGIAGDFLGKEFWADCGQPSDDHCWGTLAKQGLGIFGAKFW